MNIANKNTFPYIKVLEINDCYAYQNLSVVVNDDESVAFKHLILTGKNGSGKTTTLNFLYENLKQVIFFTKDILLETLNLKNLIKTSNPKSKERWEKHLKKISSVLPIIEGHKNFFIKKKRTDVLLTLFKAERITKLRTVNTVTKNNEISKYVKDENNEIQFRSKLKQYLVNKKVIQAFAQLNNDRKKVIQIKKFFDLFEDILKNLFEDKNLKLVFEDKAFEFYIHENGKTITFNDFSDGFSAFLNIILDLFTRVDIIREEVKNYEYNPCGFVLIDEPETHLHLELQYQVLPILTKLFPNLQFIVATHSPAVISSIKNATVYDLSTQKTVADWIVGSSYSELMMKHFGLENEYSNVADEIIETTQNLVDDKKLSPQEKFEKLKKLFDDNQKYLSPSLRLSLEVQVLKLEKQLLTSTIND